MHPATPGLPTASPPKAVTCVCAGFIKPAAIRPRKAAKCPEPLCPTRVLPPLGRRDPSPGRALPLRRRSYWLIRRSRWALSSFGFYPRLESPCRLSPVPAAPGSFPTLFRESVLGCWTPYPGGTPCARACFFHGVIGLPQVANGSAPRVCPRITTSRGVAFRGCRYSVMFRPPNLLAPRSYPPLRILPQGSRGFYVRAHRALLPPHAPDMLTARLQAIGGTGTCTPLDSQPCRLLPRPCHVSSPRHVERNGRISRFTLTCLLRIKGYGTYPAGATFGCGRRTR